MGGIQSIGLCKLKERAIAEDLLLEHLDRPLGIGLSLEMELHVVQLPEISPVLSLHVYNHGVVVTLSLGLITTLRIEEMRDAHLQESSREGLGSFACFKLTRGYWHLSK